MRDVDPRLNELFTHLRLALDALEQIALRPHRPAAEPKQQTATEKPIPPPPPEIPAEAEKLSYTVKEVCRLVGISTATFYKFLGRGDVRAVKLGNKTLILATDLREWLERLPAVRQRLNDA